MNLEKAIKTRQLWHFTAKRPYNSEKSLENKIVGHLEPILSVKTLRDINKKFIEEGEPNISAVYIISVDRAMFEGSGYVAAKDQDEAQMTLNNWCKEMFEKHFLFSLTS